MVCLASGQKVKKGSSRKQDSVPDIQGVLRGPSSSEAAPKSSFKEASRRLQDSLGDVCHVKSSYMRCKFIKELHTEGSGRLHHSLRDVEGMLKPLTGVAGAPNSSNMFQQALREGPREPQRAQGKGPRDIRHAQHEGAAKEHV